MNVSLTTELERYVKQKLAGRTYRTASEVVRDALRLLRERDESHAELRHQVQVGLEAAERDDLLDIDDALLTRIKANGRKRRAAMPRRKSARARYA